MHNKSQNNSLAVVFGWAFARLAPPLVAALALSWPAGARDDSAPWPVQLRAEAVQLAQVGYRLGRTAAPLCPRTAAGTGLALDYIGAYEQADRAAVAQLLGLDDAPQIAAVAASSPAARAGLEAGDDLLSINGVSTSALLARSPDPRLFADELEQRLYDAGVAEPLVLAVRRQGRAMTFQVHPEPVCSPRLVLKTEHAINAYTDGDNIGVTSSLVAYVQSDDELALVIGHELGHVVDRDGTPANLSERRRMEDRADLMGVRLAHCAGYDVEKGFLFNLRRAKDRGLDLFRSHSHRSPKARVVRMRAEAGSVDCPAQKLPAIKAR